MSMFKHTMRLEMLDTARESELLAEIQRREELRRAGICDYCQRPHTSSPCRFPERHKGRTE